MGVDITIGRREVVALGILASVVTLALAEVMPSSVAVGIVGAIAAEYGYLRVRLPRELLSQRRLRPGESPEPTHR